MLNGFALWAYEAAKPVLWQPSHDIKTNKYFSCADCRIRCFEAKESKREIDTGIDRAHRVGIMRGHLLLLHSKRDAAVNKSGYFMHVYEYVFLQS